MTIQTKESGAVSISEQDRPELWVKLKASGLTIAAMPPDVIAYGDAAAQGYPGRHDL